MTGKELALSLVDVNSVAGCRLIFTDRYHAYILQTITISALGCRYLLTIIYCLVVPHHETFTFVCTLQKIKYIFISLFIIQV